MESLHITAKILFAIGLAVEIWGKCLANHKILFSTDNAAVMGIIIKTSSKVQINMKLVRS